MSTEIETMSRLELDKRRRNLRNRRGLQMLQSVWRTLVAGSILGGLIWAVRQPNWIIRSPNQIKIEGEYLLSEQVIKSLIKLSYPQSLLRLQPDVIANRLESQPTIADANVTRELFPPGLRVVLTERIPVAIALTKFPATASSKPKESIELIDATGVVIPLQVYASQSSSTAKLPQLRVTGFLDDYRSYWSQLYQAVSRSPVKVTEIDCQNPENIILKTELGVVHLGAYSPKLSAQLQILDRMRQLPKQLDSSQIAYIDLKDATDPSIQMNQQKQMVKLATP